MRRSKVIIVGKLPPPYIGPAVATNIILNSALKEEFELLHLNTKVNESIDDFGKGGIGKLFKNIAIYLKLFQLMRRSKAAIILIPISQTTLGFLKDSIFILIASLFSTKILLQLRGSNFKNWINSANSLTEKYVRFCMNRTNGMIVLGENLTSLFTAYFKEENIFVVPNGCDLSIPKEKVESTTQLLYFSNLLESKGIEEVLDAMIILKQKNLSKYILNAVGAWYDPLFREKCLKKVIQYDLPVTFHTQKSGDEKWDFFKRADIFVFPPNKPEGHPWSIIEALASSLPIISTNQGAIIESVIDGKNGFIVASNSPEQIASKLELLLTDNERRNKMGNESLSHYKNNFTEGHMVENLSRVFHTVLS